MMLVLLCVSIDIIMNCMNVENFENYTTTPRASITMLFDCSINLVVASAAAGLGLDS